MGSYHPGGIHIALADGSARFITENMNRRILGWLGRRADNNVVGDF